jgi:hypothetical protein
VRLLSVKLSVRWYTHYSHSQVAASVFADSDLGCRCTAMHWFVDDMGMRAQIHQQGGGELARAAKARFPGQGHLVMDADKVIKYA